MPTNPRSPIVCLLDQDLLRLSETVQQDCKYVIQSQWLTCLDMMRQRVCQHEFLEAAKLPDAFGLRTNDFPVSNMFRLRFETVLATIRAAAE
jgi:hypothetical protein